MNARSAWKNSSPGINDKENNKKYQESVKDYMEFSGGALPSYIKDEMYNWNAQEKKMAAEEAKRAAKEAKGDMNIYNNVTNNNIEQKVNVAAEVEKIGMLLNFSVRAAIEQAMRKDKNTIAVGAM